LKPLIYVGLDGTKEMYEFSNDGKLIGKQPNTKRKRNFSPWPTELQVRATSPQHEQLVSLDYSEAFTPSINT
jgi:hypothetical protein